MPSAIKFCILLFLYASFLNAQNAWQEHKDIVYAKAGEKELKLDIYIPQNKFKPHLIIWIHGGAWRSGSKDDVPMAFVKSGFAVASVNYRLSTEAPFPAMIYDIKAAIRFLRAHNSTYGYFSRSITIAGSSAGGHLAVLVGVTNGHKELEGDIGDHPDQSSNIQGIIDYYGPTDFETILDQSTPHGISVRSPALQLLLGDDPANVPNLARLASPVFHVDRNDPPLLILHGDQDPQVPVNQSLELAARYRDNGLDVEFIAIPGAAHGGESFYNETYWNKTQNFLTHVNRRHFGPNSYRHEDIPKGSLTKYTWESKIFTGTKRDYWIYVPAQYNPQMPAALMVFQDGHTFVKENGDHRVPVVFDNLIHQNKMPVTIGLFINPGHKGPEKPESPWRNDNRYNEYDALTDSYVRFLTSEIIPEVEKEYNISSDPKMKAIGGQSSGAICAFTAAWNRPDYFNKVWSLIGSFTDLNGGHNYPFMIRKSDKKDIKIFIQDGTNDENSQWGDWWLSNLQMVSALEYKGYDYKFVSDNGKHSGYRGGLVLPEAMIWLWSDVINKP